MIRRCNSIREAARRLFIDSSALNRQLLALEAEIGTPLFERLGRGLKLTAAGEIFSKHVIGVLQDEERMMGELEGLKGGYSGQITVMSVEGLSTTLVSKVLMEMIARYPGIKTVIKNGTSSHNARAVIDGDADVGLSFAADVNHELRECCVGRFPMGAIMHPDHPLASRSHVSFAECAAFPLILSSPELVISMEMKPVISKHKGALTVLLETASIELAKSIAAEGRVIAFQTKLGVEVELREQRLAFVPLKTSPRILSELRVLVRENRTMLPALQAFAELLVIEIRRRELEELG